MYCNCCDINDQKKAARIYITGYEQALVDLKPKILAYVTGIPPYDPRINIVFRDTESIAQWICNIIDDSLVDSSTTSDVTTV